MTTAFPTGLDAFNDPSSGDELDTAGVVHNVQHSDANDAIEAVQAKVGIDGSAVTSTLDYKAAHHAHTGTGSAQVDHANLTDVTANQHHNQSHTNADHSAAGTPSTQAFGDSAATGSSTSDAKSDHKHGMPADPRLAIVGINAQSGTTYTTVLGDAGELVTGSNGSATTFSIPTNASVAYPVGTVLMFAQVGAGQITINAVSSGTTTINSTGGTPTAPKLRAQYSSASAIKTATDVWLVVGDIA